MQLKLHLFRKGVNTKEIKTVWSYFPNEQPQNDHILGFGIMNGANIEEVDLIKYGLNNELMTLSSAARRVYMY